MTGRPEPLFPLFASLETLPGVGPKTAKLMANMSVATPRDLIFTLPTGGCNRTGDGRAPHRAIVARAALSY